MLRGMPRLPLRTAAAVLATAAAAAAPWPAAALARAAGPDPSSAPAAIPASVLLARLPVLAEHRSGYDRRLFRHWIDADRDGCTTREEVLLAEALEPPQEGPGCSLARGRWVSRYDGRGILAAAALDVDHAVPLAEAWDSGAWAWDEPTRRSYANDLGAADSLLAVSAASNRAKGDQDPAEWLPRRADRCRYAAAWVATKTRWSLAVDSAERTAVAAVLDGCGPRRLRVTVAAVALT